MADVWIGLGGNLGDVAGTFQQAIEHLAGQGLDHIRCSAVYRTAPVGPQDQPDFLNAVIRASTDLSPPALLELLLETEQHFGRERRRHWGERTLDLDLLLYDSQCIDTPTLQVPHPRLAERAFVLVPMADLDGGRLIPGSDGATVASLLQQCNRDGVWYHGSLSG